jgi:SnoaL-like domain
MTLATADADRIWNRWLDMWNEDPEIAHDIIGDTYRVHLPTAGATIDPAAITDAAAMAGWVRGFTGKFANLRYRTDFGPLVDGDRLVSRWYGTATYLGRTGWPRDVAGNPVTMVGVDILRIADGRIVECWTQGAETRPE